MLFDTDAETLPREELRALQLQRLQTTVARCYQTVTHYRQALDELGLKPSHIKTLDDIRLLPFTEKAHLRESYPFGLFAVPMDQVIRVHASSGTTGKPTVVGYTRRDIRTWARLMARAMAAAGLRPGDRFHNAHGYGLFTGGLGFHYGAEELGVMVAPMSGGQTQRQVMLLRDFAADGMCGTPSYALNIAETAEAMDVDIRRLPLRVGMFGGEPWSEGMRFELESRLGIDAVDVYGLSEIMGPGVGVECREEKRGQHIFEDHFLPEIVDPDTGQPLPWGETGELVLTTLTKEACPLLRYRTRDITALDPAPCRCGRTHLRMRRVQGRSDDMLIIRGVNVFPSQVEDLLMQTENLTPFYQLEAFRDGNLDQLVVNVEGAAPLLAQGQEAMARVAAKAQKTIKDYIGISTTVVIKHTGEIARSPGKAVRVIDHRS